MVNHHTLAVIIPVLNEEAIIQTSLEQLLHQTMPKKYFQIIVVDNGSVDGTIQSVLTFIRQNPEIHIRLVHEHHKGIAYATKHGFSNALDADILVKLDADSIVRPTFLYEIDDKFKNITTHAIVGRLYQPWDIFIGMSQDERLCYVDLVRRKILLRNFVSKYYGPLLVGPFYASRTSAYKQAGEIDTDPSVLRYGDDVSLGAQMLLNGIQIRETSIPVTISSRRLFEQAESYLSGEYYWGNRTPSFDHKFMKKKIPSFLMNSEKIRSSMLRTYTELMIRYTAFFIYKDHSIRVHERFLRTLEGSYSNTWLEAVRNKKSAQSVYNILHDQLYDIIQKKLISLLYEHFPA